jgi:hypothetical protein
MSAKTVNIATNGTEQYNECKNIITNSKILEFLARKYMIALQLFNIILKNAQLPGIRDITQFQSIRRDFIIDEKNTAEFELLLPTIISQFGENECKSKQRKQIKHYITTVLKSMCKQLNLVLIKKYKNVQSNHIVKSYVLYSIEYSKKI